MYLCYVPYGISDVEAFFNSYIKNPAGIEHTLLVIFKGFDNENELQVFRKKIDTYHIPYQTHLYYGEGFDISAYFNAAQQIFSKYILFFNTRSQILASGWLAYYLSGMTTGVGMISATGSHESHILTVYKKHPIYWELQKSFTYNFRKYKLFVKALLYWSWYFKFFPNPHLRTNAFLVRVSDFLEYPQQKITTKFKAFIVESGKNSLTNFFIRKKQKVFIIDQHGKIYEPEQWKQSNTFRNGNQENLLVADNQTILYDNAGNDEKKLLSEMAWGK